MACAVSRGRRIARRRAWEAGVGRRKAPGATMDRSEFWQQDMEQDDRLLMSWPLVP
jgi:hypothetical protein